LNIKLKTNEKQIIEIKIMFFSFVENLNPITNILIYLFQGKVSLNRIQSYLNKEELNDEAVTRNVNTGKFS
jgi:hypothetical protein